MTDSPPTEKRPPRAVRVYATKRDREIVPQLVMDAMERSVREGCVASCWPFLDDSFMRRRARLNLTAAFDGVGDVTMTVSRAPIDYEGETIPTFVLQKKGMRRYRVRAVESTVQLSLDCPEGRDMRRCFVSYIAHNWWGWARIHESEHHFASFTIGPVDLEQDLDRRWFASPS